MIVVFFMTPPLEITDRPFEGDADWQRVRQLLIETRRLVPTGWNWEIRRWHGGRFHIAGGAIPPEWRTRIHLWEDAGGRLVGVAHPEGRGDVHLQLHPDYRALQPSMFAWAEEALPIPDSDGASQSVVTFVFDYDTPRRRLLQERGWAQQSWGGVTRRLRFGGWRLPAPNLDPGYKLRTIRAGDAEDCQRLADLLNAAFNRTIHTAEDYMTFSTLAPSYRADLDLLAVAPDGAFAAFVGVTFDGDNRLGIYEPVCTHPAHRRHGLARSLMFEGLHRLKALGALDAVVDTGDDPAANALYESVGFSETYHGTGWKFTRSPSLHFPESLA
ncbi:MAG: GNAT family N-acetyltransferase [Anaerolineae bacterium]|nr:GNAT family N-acetyltransferase [Anaerolineae bacterium]